ncbi:MAG: arsenate reductase, partial [Candidatus Methylomirabilis sp.]|nr:arsenate reductase [Deltaproteobacteria bacterium]
MIVLYGLKTCDTCKRARRFLDGRGAAYRFHDVREDGLDAKALRAWAREVGWERLVNKASATWRGLADADKADLDEAKALGLLLANPTLMKRPVFDLGDRRIVGFDEKT